MPKVTFIAPGETVGAAYEGKVGESILDVALNHDVPIQHACGGFCACTTCHIRVKEGAESLTLMEEHEQDRLDSMTGLSDRSRLGCQAKLRSGDVVVEVVNWDV